MRIDLVSADQHESLTDLMHELHAFYNEGAVVSRDLVRTHLRQNILAADSHIRLIVAEDGNGTIVGFAAVALFHSLVDPTPENSRQCLLKELYVRSSERSHGIGRLLMTGVARFADQHGCGRIDWNVKSSNQAGITFYTRLGGEQVDDRLSYRIARPGIERLAGDAVGASYGI